MAESWKLTLPCTRDEAEMLSMDIGALALRDPPPTLVTEEVEAFNPDKWVLHAYFDGRPDDASISALQAMVPSAAGSAPVLERLADEDWLTVSQAAITPVHAGRFYVHTSTNKKRQPPGTTAFLIEASRAFGTGSHETTSGCLAMLDAMKRRGARFNHIADIGTGTGLLAFAARTLWPHAYLTASDIDPVSIEITAENAAANLVKLGAHPGEVALCVASGVDHSVLLRRAPYDLVIANILAGPLVELAPAFARVLIPGGTLVIAGLLDTQQATVARAYRSAGFRVAEALPTGDWPCLRLVLRQRLGWRRPVRTTGRTTQPPGDFGSW